MILWGLTLLEVVMDASTVRFIALLVALCLLVGINTAASVLHVPLGDRAAADITGAITALGGLLIGDRFQASRGL